MGQCSIAAELKGKDLKVKDNTAIANYNKSIVSAKLKKSWNG